MNRIVVAIPVHNEEERIGACLRALASQDGHADHEVLLLLNNCTDRTAAVVAEIAPSLPIRVHAPIVTFPPEIASAGAARRAAMEMAAEIARADGVLLTTDADSRVSPDWIARNLAALADGAEAVAGRAVIDPAEALLIPPHLHADDAMECAYAARLDEMDQLLDPDPADPWPRHDEASGASLAVTVAAYRRAGGIPAIPLGEDRAFVAALRLVDAAIRHAPEVQVIVSGRLEGRARGGMADTMKRRMTRQDEWIDDRLEPARDRYRRARMRARFRAARDGAGSAEGLAGELRLPVAFLREALAETYFGAAWERMEQRSPALERAGVRRADLGREMAQAEAILSSLRLRQDAAD